METTFHTRFVLLTLLALIVSWILLLVTKLQEELPRADYQFVTDNKLNHCAVKFCSGFLTVWTAFSVLLFHTHVQHNKLAQRTPVFDTIRDNIFLLARFTTVFPFPADFMTKIFYELLACSVPRSTALPSFVHSGNVWWTEQSNSVPQCTVFCSHLSCPPSYVGIFSSAFLSQSVVRFSAAKIFLLKSVSENCGYLLRK